MHQCAPPLSHAGNFGTRKVYLPVHRHQQLHRFNLRIVCAQRPARMRELIAQVLDGMTQNFKGVARTGRDAPAVYVALNYQRSGNGSWNRKTTQR